MELKYYVKMMNHSNDLSFNRTTVELKLIIKSIWSLLARDRFNRATVELKQPVRTDSPLNPDRFNRTTVELKLPKSFIL